MPFLPSLKQYPPQDEEKQYELNKENLHKEGKRHEELLKLDDIDYRLRQIENELKQGRYPIDLPNLPVQTNANGQPLTQQWHVDYRNRKHLFAFVTGTSPVNFISSDGFTLGLANAWTNVGFPEGTQFMPTANNVNVILHLRATDEVIP